MKENLAKLISILGHPMLTFLVFTLVSLFIYEEFHEALLHASLVIGGVFLPLFLKMYWNTRKGNYTNFDISDQKQRQTWYLSTLAILLVTSIVLFITEQPRTLRLAVLFVLILLTISKLVNFYLKCSLHVSLNSFLAFLIMTMNLRIGLLFLVCVLFIAWSRFVLKRHTLKEIIAGAIIGFLVGIVAFVII